METRLCTRVCLTLLTVLFICSVSGVDGADKKTCNVASHIGSSSNNKHAKFKVTPTGGGQRCIWTVLGDVDCNVALKCNINIPKSGDDCGDNFLKISDGSRGSKKYCGEENLSNIVPSEGLRHLFAVYKSGSVTDKKYTGVNCTATCVDPKTPLAQKITLPKMDRKTERCVCGLQNKDNRIVGGDDAKKFEFPWQAAIVKAGTRRPSCGASLINDRFILTATHCFWFENVKPENIEVLLHAHVLDMTKRAGAVDAELGVAGATRSSGYNLSKVTDADEHTQRFKVSEIIMHPFFNDTFDFDYALLKLDRKIKLNEADAPTPVCLPSEDTWDTKDFRGQKFTVVGWGLADERAGGTTRVLQKLEVPYIPSETCAQKDWYGKSITSRMFCAGFEEGIKDACTGDSGGPICYVEDKKQYFQYGIVSWGKGCAGEKMPGVYSKITEMMQWIHFYTSEEDAKWCALK